MLRTRFYIDPTSSSGIRMKIANGARNPAIMRKAGDIAGFLNQDNYWEVGVRGVYLKVSRIVWILANGQIPDAIIVDHKDGNTQRNEVDNLQLLSRPANTRALNGPYRCNRTGFLGVFPKPNNSWQAGMRRNGKLHYLGTFSSPRAAARRYNEAVMQWAEEHGETARYLNPVE